MVTEASVSSVSLSVKLKSSAPKVCGVSSTVETVAALAISSLASSGVPLSSLTAGASLTPEMVKVIVPVPVSPAVSEIL